MREALAGGAMVLSTWMLFATALCIVAILALPNTILPLLGVSDRSELEPEFFLSVGLFTRLLIEHLARLAPRS